MPRASEVGGLGERSMVSWLAAIPCTGGARFTQGRPTATGEPSGEKTTADGREGALRASRYALSRQADGQRRNVPPIQISGVMPVPRSTRLKYLALGLSRTVHNPRTYSEGGHRGGQAGACRTYHPVTHVRRRNRLPMATHQYQPAETHRVRNRY